MIHPQGYQDLHRPLVPVLDPTKDPFDCTARYHQWTSATTYTTAKQRGRAPESADDQAKIKHWRGRALQAEARLAERDRQLPKQNIDILLVPTCQAHMVHVIYIDKDDPNPDLPWASRLEVAGTHCKRIEHCLANVRRPGREGWLGPAPVSDRDPAMTLLHNLRWWPFPCSRGGMQWDGAIDGWRKTVLAFSNERIHIMQRDDPMHTLIPGLTDYSENEIMVVATPERRRRRGCCSGRSRPPRYDLHRHARS